MKFYCELKFKNIEQPTKHSSFRFIMKAKGWNDIRNKLVLCSDSSIFHGWELIESRAQINRVEGLAGCFCTYSKRHGLLGTFKVLPTEVL
jgi:hypothetical protein